MYPGHKEEVKDGSPQPNGRRWPKQGGRHSVMGSRG
eukprot:CAMPEP_0177619306 /NCGR_PEP_ID=MMETSP0419_2-20121207/26171_1 /TAXON_ID=582737 /ORGANISM="Tetraselmis sp., Strain GSL018" /LENGTH=35 /DNA_ID= /DNA_START= /DNA_END= /DNA_ORIENTATION=